jgi:hypothetical protein
VEHIIVLGHRHCGGIRALMTRSDFNRCLFFFDVHGMKKLRFIGFSNPVAKSKVQVVLVSPLLAV